MELGPWHSLVCGSRPSRSTERCCCGPEGTRGEVGSPQKEHALVGFHPWGSAGEEAQALLTTPCLSSCTDHQFLQTPARATVTMASMRGASASATPSVCTTRAAAATTPPPAKPKVPAPRPPPCRAGAAGVALGAQYRGGSEGLCWVSSAPTMSAGGGQRQDLVLGVLWQWGFLAGSPAGVCANLYFLGANVSRTQTLWENPRAGGDQPAPSRSDPGRCVRLAGGRLP